MANCTVSCNFACCGICPTCKLITGLEFCKVCGCITCCNSLVICCSNFLKNCACCISISIKIECCGVCFCSPLCLICYVLSTDCCAFSVTCPAVELEAFLNGCFCGSNDIIIVFNKICCLCIAVSKCTAVCIECCVIAVYFVNSIESNVCNDCLFTADDSFCIIFNC